MKFIISIILIVVLSHFDSLNGQGVFECLNKYERVLTECYDESISIQENRTISQVFILEQIYQNISWPRKADHISGKFTVNVRLFVDNSGNVEKINILNDPGYGFKDATIAALDFFYDLRFVVDESNSCNYSFKIPVNFKAD